MSNAILPLPPPAGNNHTKRRQRRLLAELKALDRQQVLDDESGMLAREILEEFWPHLLLPEARALAGADNWRRAEALFGPFEPLGGTGGDDE